MDDFSRVIFEPDDSDPAALEDAQNALAGSIFEKLAQEEGVDPGSLTEAERTTYLQQLRGLAPATSKEASAMTQPNSMQEQPEVSAEEWDAFVTQEATKIAAAEGIDVTTMVPADFAAIKLATAELINEDPDAYFAALEAAQAGEAAEEELQAKVAEAEYLGECMAAAFARALSEGTEPDGEKIAAGMADKFQAFAGRVGKAVHDKTGLGKKGVEAAKATASKSHAENLKKGVNPELAHRTHQHSMGKHYAGLGKKVLGAGAATAAAAGGAAAAHSRSKKSQEEIEAEGLAFARAFLIEQGIDPDNGQKVAQAGDVDPEVVAFAQNLLREKKYIP